MEEVRAMPQLEFVQWATYHARRAQHMELEQKTVKRQARGR